MLKNLSSKKRGTNLPVKIPQVCVRNRMQKMVERVGRFEPMLETCIN